MQSNKLAHSISKFKDIDRKLFGDLKFSDPNSIIPILKKLSLIELLSLKKLNSGFYQLIKNNETINEKIWQHKFKEYFPHTYETLTEKQNFESSTKLALNNCIWHDFFIQTVKKQFACKNIKKLKNLLFLVKKPTSKNLNCIIL